MARQSRRAISAFIFYYGIGAPSPQGNRYDFVPMPDQTRKNADSPGPRNRPWHALTVRLAIVVTVLGAAFWGFDRASDSGSAQTLGGYAPALMRFGVSFLGGFTLGWLLRRFLKWTLLIGGIIVISIVVLKKTGAFDLPWDQIEDHVEQGSTWLQTQAGSAKKLVTGYLPSGVAAVIGGFLGFRSR